MTNPKLSYEEAVNEIDRHRRQILLLRSILESPHGVIIFSLDTQYCYISFTKAHYQIMKDIWGASIDVGTCMLDVILDVADRQQAKDNFDAALSGESIIKYEEYGDINLRRTCWENRYSPMYDDHGHIIGLTVFVTDITEQRQAEKKRREYTKHLADHIEKERVRIARELHDSIGQDLTLLSFDVIKTQNELSPDHGYASDRLANIYGSVQKMAVNIQHICTDLRPSLLDELGLASAIEWISEDFSRRSGITCKVIGSVGLCQKQQCAINIFRIVQESLTNIGKYSQATAVTITLARTDQYIILEIRDDGCGFELNAIPSRNGFGIIGMRERADSMEAEFDIASSPNKGTTIFLKIPCGTRESCIEKVK